MKIEAFESTSTSIAARQPVGYQRLPGSEKNDAVTETTDTAPSNERILYNRLESVNAETHALAQKIRSIDDTFNQVENNVRQMQSILNGIVKNFPPFPINSSERIQSLRQFSALRKMIDQLTFPPPEKSPEMILGDTSTYNQAGDWEMKTPDGETVSLGRQPIHNGSAGLNIPELAPDASDVQVGSTFEKTAAALTAIDRKRRAFVADANRVIVALS